MRRKDLIAKITAAAKAANVEFEFVREGGNHTIYRCGDKLVVIARHNEITERTAQGTMRQLDEILGEGWWR